ncbi:hypothetical protein T484DRAFT_1751324 [Baffinella frigidus]|nr:hypothetical protein T484DRAFT_1751324 [Cryptophyta sp. CCMP2293]
MAVGGRARHLSLGPRRLAILRRGAHEITSPDRASYPKIHVPEIRVSAQTAPGRVVAMASHRYSESREDGEYAGDAAGAREEEPLWLKTSRRAAAARPIDRKLGAAGRVAWDASTVGGAVGARRVADKDTWLKTSKRAASVTPWDPQPGKLPWTPRPDGNQRKFS